MHIRPVIVVQSLFRAFTYLLRSSTLFSRSRLIVRRLFHDNHAIYVYLAYHTNKSFQFTHFSRLEAGQRKHLFFNPFTCCYTFVARKEAGLETAEVSACRATTTCKATGPNVALGAEDQPAYTWYMCSCVYVRTMYYCYMYLL